MGVLFFIVNVVFAFVILFMCLYSSVRALMSKNPETRYQPMRDDRGSFIKSSTNLAQTTELDALGATARGDGRASPTGGYYSAERKRMEIEEEEASMHSSLHVNQQGQSPYAGYQKEGQEFRSQSPYGPPRGPTGSGFPSRTASPAQNMWQRGVGY
jgi:hypothetical protein